MPYAFGDYIHAEAWLHTNPADWIKNKTVKRLSYFLVEMARFELASENLFPKLSTSVVYLLRFPWENADKQALTLGSPLIRDKVQGSPLFTCTAKRRPYLSRGTLSKDGS